MELKAIILFTEFPYVNVLYRAFDGEYFVELDDVQAYLIGVGGGAYTVINRVTPLPSLPESLPEDSPIWVLINNPTVISNGLRYDGVISYTNTTVGSLGAVTFTVNKVGAFRVGNYIFAVSRKGASAGMLKYGQITAINSNNLTINFLEFEGTGSLAADEWDIVLTGKKGDRGDNGKDAVEILTGVGTIYLTNAQLGKHLIVPANSNITQISFRNTTISSTTTFLCLKPLFLDYIPNNMSYGLPGQIGQGASYDFVTPPLPAQLVQATSNDFFAIENFTYPQNGLWLKKTSLKSGTTIKVGIDHLSFPNPKTGDLYINISTKHIYEYTSAEDIFSEFAVWNDLGAIN